MQPSPFSALSLITQTKIWEADPVMFKVWWAIAALADANGHLKTKPSTYKMIQAALGLSTANLNTALERLETGGHTKQEPGGITLTEAPGIALAILSLRKKHQQKMASQKYREKKDTSDTSEQRPTG